MLIFNRFKIFSIFLFCMFSLIFITTSEANETLNEQLEKAFINGNISQVKILIKQGADISIRINYETALMWASRRGHIEVVKYLVSKGVELNIKTGTGVSALTSASSNGHLEIVKYLVSKGANINTENNIKYTGLMAASSNGHLEIVKFLLQNGTNIDAKTLYEGYTALMYASRSGEIDVVKYLVSSNANINLQNRKNKTALDLARLYSHLDIVEYLKKQDAK